jgi:hypothetical protein
MTTEAHRAATIPPTPAEWVEMSDRHLLTLRVAFVFANAPASKFDGLPAGSMGNVVTMLVEAANFHRTFAELCEAAERRLLDAAITIEARSSRRPEVLGMTGKIEGSTPDKRFRIKRDERAGDILASFDTLEDAIRNVRRRRSDWRYVIFDGRTIVWPKSRIKRD